MRKMIFAAILLLACSSLFGASPTCTNPTLTITGIPGDGCAGTIDFASATYSTATSELNVIRYMDVSSPKLYTDCAAGTHLQKVTLSYPNIGTDGTNHPTTIAFQDVQVTEVDESVNPTNETVKFKYAKWMIETGGGGQNTGGSVRGTARGGTLNVAVVGGDGNAQPASHFEMSIRPGGVTTTSVQLLSPTPPPIRASTLKLGQQSHSAPQPHMDNGVIEIRSANGQVLGRYAFSGGVLNGGNLRSQKVSISGTGGRLP